MSTSSEVHSCALPPHLAWPSLVSRSISAWNNLSLNEETRDHLPISITILQDHHSLDDFLAKAGNALLFWFFQKRSTFMSQKRMKKWSRDDLDDYILLPASRDFVSRRDCFFISHFWNSPSHPDPEGEYLRLHQSELEAQTWLYIWVDWSCMPQDPRSLPEEAYFHHCLQTMSGLIRNCGFMYFYPPFQPRLWILYEIAEYVLTCEEGILMTSDIETFRQHIDEMLEMGVQDTLTKYGYRCSYQRDRQYLTSWLELLVLFKRLQFGIDFVRKIMDHITWFSSLKTLSYPLAGLEINKFEGTLVVNGEMHTFTPFPKWDDGKFS